MQSSSLDRLRQVLRQLPGLGARSAERVALHLLVERPERLVDLREALAEAAARIGRCPACGNLAEGGGLCPVCADPARGGRELCVVESVPDLAALERTGAFRGRYHVLHGRLSPLHGIGPAQLNVAGLAGRIAAEGIAEVVLALGNDLESEATCHWLRHEVLAGTGVRVTRIGFGLPSGGGLPYADAGTLRSALDGRRVLGE